MDLSELLREAEGRAASDVHLRVGAPPTLRIDGRLHRCDGPPMTAEGIASIARSIMPEASAHEFATSNEADFAYEAGGIGRFRVNCFRQQDTTAMVFRRISSSIPTIDELGLPPVVRTIAEERSGLVLVTGRIGMGKTTTLAAMIDHINRSRDGHIITIEDPVEFRHADRRSLVTHREIGVDTDDFRGALRRVLRQDPDVILIGEMRDAETAWAALAAAETGHLVLSTLHTSNATESVNRILDFFPAFQHTQVRAALSSSLRAVVSQRLLTRARGIGRVPAVEVMIANGRIAERVLDPTRGTELEDVIASGSFYGMQTFDQSLLALYAAGTITRNAAVGSATHPHDLRLAIASHDAEREHSVPAAAAGSA